MMEELRIGRTITSLDELSDLVGDHGDLLVRWTTGPSAAPAGAWASCPASSCPGCRPARYGWSRGRGAVASAVGGPPPPRFRPSR